MRTVGIRLLVWLGLGAWTALAAPALAQEGGTGSWTQATADLLAEDEVFRLVRRADGAVAVHYVWGDPAVVYEVGAETGKTVYAGRRLCILRIKAKALPPRSKAHVQAGATFTALDVRIAPGEVIHADREAPIMILMPRLLSHDSTGPDAGEGLHIGRLFRRLWQSTGLYDMIARTGTDWSIGLGRLVMMLVGGVLLYLAIVKQFEPLLLVPIGFGGILANIPLAGLAGPDGILQHLYAVGIESGAFPLLIFLGIGAMTDFGPLIANPITSLLGAAAQLGIFAALIGALVLTHFIPAIDFSLRDAASIGIIGGADGPTSIFLASRLSPSLLGAIAVAAYSYMALVPIIQPPIMRWLTTDKERKVRMQQLRPVTKVEKIVFPVGITLLCALLLPDAAPLIGLLMFGNLLRECGVVERLSQTAQNALINIVTIFLGLTVGSKLSADKFLNLETLGILLLGLIAFAFSTAGGVLFGKVLCRLSGGKINPLIGAAGVSAVPMAARVVNKVGLEADPHNFLMMHAMGPNVAGVIGSAVAAGVLLKALS